MFDLSTLMLNNVMVLLLLPKIQHLPIHICDDNQKVMYKFKLLATPTIPLATRTMAFTGVWVLCLWALTN